MQKAPDVRPDKRQELRTFIARFAQLPFDEHCVQPYAAVRAELWRMHGNPDRSKPHKHKERLPEELSDKVTGAALGVDEPDLIIASIALAQNLVLVTDDRNVGMSRVKDAADAVFRSGSFSNRLRVENWLESIA
jgi:predicted nucleic acid-binding protein